MRKLKNLNFGINYEGVSKFSLEVGNEASEWRKFHALLEE